MELVSFLYGAVLRAVTSSNRWAMYISVRAVAMRILLCVITTVKTLPFCVCAVCPLYLQFRHRNVRFLICAVNILILFCSF
jgi:hypothetical protein